MNSIQDQERKATDETVGKQMRRSATEMKRQQHTRTFQQGKQIKKNCKVLEMKSSLCEIKTHWKA